MCFFSVCVCDVDVCVPYVMAQTYRQTEHIPVTGASMSIMVFSDLSSAAPSLMILSATFSSILPSSMKCCLSISVRGLFVFASNTSAIDSLCDGGNGTPVEGGAKSTRLAMDELIKKNSNKLGQINRASRCCLLSP